MEEENKDLTVADFDESVTTDDITEAMQEIKGIAPVQTEEANLDQTVSSDPMAEAIIEKVAQNEIAAEIIQKDIEAEEKTQLDQTISTPAPNLGVSTPQDSKLTMPNVKKETPLDIENDIPDVIEEELDGIERDEKGRIIRPVPQDTNKNGTAGKPTVMNEATLTKLRIAFRMGCTDREACLFAGIATATLYKYQEKNPEYAEQKEEWKEQPILKARIAVYQNLKDPDMAFKFLERKKRDEFALRHEMTGADGESIEMTLNKLESNYDELATKAAAAVAATTEPGTSGETDR